MRGAYKYLGLVITAALVTLLVIVPRETSAQSVPSENPCPYVVRMTGLSASTQLINANGSNAIRICSYNFSLGLNATTSAVLVWGTGSVCGTNTVDASPKLAFGSAVTAGSISTASGGGDGFIDYQPTRGVSNYCLIVSGSSPAVDGLVTYGLY